MGWWETYNGIVIGDELADLVGDWVDSLTKTLTKKYPTISKAQVLSTISFCTGYLEHYDKKGPRKGGDPVLVQMTREQAIKFGEENTVEANMNIRVAPNTELINVVNPFTGEIV